MGGASLHKPAAVSGGIFALAFFAGLILVGDQAGAFADSERAYREIFDDVSHRVEDAAGSLLLMVSSVALAVFAHLLSSLSDDGRAKRPVSTVVIRASGMLSAVAILAAGAAFLTVPTSLAIGAFFDDPGIETAQVILPHFGYIMLVVAAVIPAVVMMVGSSRLQVLPVWFRRATVPVSVILVVVSMTVSGLVLLPLWVRGRSSNNPTDQPEPDHRVTRT